MFDEPKVHLTFQFISMTEADLVKKIQELKKIRPKKDWVVLTKSQILGEEPKVLFFPFFKPALATVTAFGILFGIFSLAQNSLPGDILYPIKKITEKSQAVFVSEEKLPEYNLAIVSKRLEDLNTVAENNQVKNLAPAISEFEMTKVMAEKAVCEAIKNKSEKEVVEIVKKVAPKLGEINKQEEKVYATLNIEPKEEEEPAEKSVYMSVVEVLIKDAQKSTLTDKQENNLEKVAEYYQNEEYAKALELYLTGSLNK